jgi:hypothetical protein
MVVDPDLLQSECLLVFLTGSLRASEVAAKRAKEYKIMADFISKSKRKGNERRNERRMEMKVCLELTESLEPSQVRVSHAQLREVRVDPLEASSIIR